MDEHNVASSASSGARIEAVTHDGVAITIARASMWSPSESATENGPLPETRATAALQRILDEPIARSSAFVSSCIPFGKETKAPWLLDASRGGLGDPADDVTCLAVNYVFFALGRRSSAGALRELWHRFWSRYLAGSGDRELLEVAAPFLAWRGLVLACPRWYPDLADAARDRLLGLVERALAAPAFDPAMADPVFG